MGEHLSNVKAEGESERMLSQMEVYGKEYGIFTTLFIFTTKKTFSNPKWTYTKRGQNEYREEFFEDILKIAHQKCGKDFLEDVLPKICRIFF